jgi:hypothetical protein
LIGTIGGRKQRDPASLVFKVSLLCFLSSSVASFSFQLDGSPDRWMENGPREASGRTVRTGARDDKEMRERGRGARLRSRCSGWQQAARIRRWSWVKTAPI